METGRVVVGPVQVKVKVQRHSIFGVDRAFIDQPHVRIGIETTKVPSVHWTNATGGGARLWFPNGGEVFDPPPGGFLNPIDIPPDGLTLKVKAVPAIGDYHYHVYCDSLKDCAQGNSEPRLSVP